MVDIYSFRSMEKGCDSVAGLASESSPIQSSKVNMFLEVIFKFFEESFCVRDIRAERQVLTRF